MFEVSRYRLNTATAPLVGALAAVAYVPSLLADGSPWVGDATWAVQRLGTPLPVLLIALAMLSALDAAAPASGTRAVFRTAPARPQLSLAVGRWATAAAPLLVVHIVFCLGVVAVCVRSSRVVDVPIGSIALQGAAIAFAAALGIAIGSFAPSLVAAGAAGAAQAVTIFAGDDLFVLSAGDSPYAGLELRPAVLLPATAALLTAASLLACLRPKSNERPEPRVGYSAALAAVAITVGTSVAIGGYPIRQSGATADICSDGVPRVCLFPQYRRLEDRLVFAFENMSGSAVRAGVPRTLLPDRVIQVVPGGPALQQGSADFLLQFDELAGDGIRPFTVAEALVTPDWCPALNSTTAPPDSYFAHQSDAMAWLAHEAGRLGGAEFRALAPRLWKLPESDRTAAVVRTLERFRRCDLT